MSLSGGCREGSKKLMMGEWRDETLGEYVKVPLENCFVLDEETLTRGVGDRGMGYELERLWYLEMLLGPYGGSRDVGLQAGETVIVSPATGAYGGAAVHVVLAIGAEKVIAMGMNQGKLKKSKCMSERVEVVGWEGLGGRYRCRSFGSFFKTCSSSESGCMRGCISRCSFSC